MTGKWVFFGLAIVLWTHGVAQDSSLVSPTIAEDSIATIVSTDTKTTQLAPILELKTGKPMARPPARQQEALIAFLLLYWSLFAFLRLFNYTLYQYRWRALINFNLGAQYFRDQSVFSSTLHSLYHVHFLLGISLLVSYMAWYHLERMPWPIGRVIITVFGVLVGLYILRALLGWLLSQLFGVFDTLRFAQFYSNLSYSYLAFLLMPVVTVGWFAPEPWPTYVYYIGIALVGLALIGKYFRSWQIAKEYFSIYKYHLIAYICTAEIAPVFLLVKGTGLVIPVVS